MKLKKVLFGSLLMSVAFAACTNEELLEVNAPVSTEGAVSLGEGYTIEGVKGVSSRYVISEGANGLSAVWEATDTVGGAWIGYQTADQKAAAQGAYEKLGSKIMSNHPFAFVQGSTDMTVGKFSAPTNVFEGKHILYYPYNYKMKSVADEVLVKFDTNATMDCTAGKELDHVNANTFAYTTIDAAGGPEAGVFSLNQAGNIWAIKLGVDAANVDRAQNQEIEKVIIESAGMLVAEGKLVGGKADADGQDVYSNYAGVYSAKTTTSTYIVTPKNATADYQITDKGTTGVTKKAFYMSVLPANKDIDALTVRAIMANGRIFTTTLKKEDHADLFAKMIVKGGALINLTAVLDKEEAAGSIYTAEQFNQAMAQADPKTITLGTDITVSSLSFNKEGKTVEIEGAKLTVEGDMTVTKGVLSVADLVVEGELLVEGGSLTAGSLVTENEIVVESGVFNAKAETLPNITLSADANLEAEKYGKIVMARGSRVAVVGGKLNGGVTMGVVSTLKISGTEINSGINNDGGNIEISGSVVNKGTITSENGVIEAANASGDKLLNNGGTINLKNTDVDVELNNNGTVNVTGKDASLNGIINKAVVTGDNALSAGAITINLDDQDSSESGKLYGVITADIDNEAGSTLTVQAGTLKEANGNGTTLRADDNGAVAKMEIKSDGKFVLNSSTNGTNLANGTRIIINNLENIDLNSSTGLGSNVDVATEITSQAELTGSLTVAKKPYGDETELVKTVILNCSGLKINQNTANLLCNKIIEAKANFSFDAEASGETANAVNLTMTKAFNVNGTVTVTSKVAGSKIVVTGKNYVYSGQLKIGKNITLSGDDSGATIVLKGGLNPVAVNKSTTDAEADTNGSIDGANITLGM